MAPSKKSTKKLPTRHAAPGRAKSVSAPPRSGGNRATSDTPLLYPKEWRLVAILLTVTCLAFVNALDGEFVYDDRFQVLKNPTIQSIANITRMFTESVWQFMSPASLEPVGSYYRPLFNIALILNYQTFGFNVFGWHLVSVILHLGVTLLVYLLSRQWGLSSQVAAAVALLFGLHPIHSESVAWVSGLPDPLAAVFILSSLLLYERYYDGRAGSWILIGLSLLLAFLGALSKEVAVVFPLFLALREWFRGSEADPRAPISRIVKRTAPFVSVILIYLVLRYAVLGFLSKVEGKAVGVPIGHVLFTIPSILLGYVRLLFLPFPLAVTYDYQYVTSAADARFWAPVLALGAMAAGTIWLVRSSPVGQRALAFLAVFLIPVLNLRAFNPDESLLHDRYLYLPSVGFCLLIGLALAKLSARIPSHQPATFSTATIILGLIFFGLTIHQNGFWKNDFIMANQALRWAPQRPFLLNYIGASYSQQNNLVEAERYYLEALKNAPNYYDAYSNIGDVYRRQGKVAEAEQAYLKAIELGSPYTDTYYNLGVTYTSQGKLAEAEIHLRRALEIHPSHLAARYNLGWVYDHQGKLALAEQAYRETLQLNPAYPEPRINLGILLTKQGRFKEASEQLLYAQRYSPEHPVLIYALGDVYMKTNRHQEAIDAFSRLTRREPQHRLAHTSLGLCYEVLGNVAQAKAEYEKAIEVAPLDSYTDTARQHLSKLP